MAAESRFAEVSDEYLKSTKYGMKTFNARNAQNEFELLTNVTNVKWVRLAVFVMF